MNANANQNEALLRESLISHMETIRQCYVRRDIEGYLSGFAKYYRSFQLNDSEWLEDICGLRQKMLSEFERFELLSMEFEVLQVRFVADRGYAHLRYRSRLRPRNESARILLDSRENLIVAKHLGREKWLIEAKITVSSEVSHE